MRSTTVRFADPVYQDLESASQLTGLPINSIVTVACLEWLRRNVDADADRPPLAEVHPMPLQPRRMRELAREWVGLTARPLAWPEPLSPFTLAAQDALSRALGASERAGRSWIGTGHLLQGLAEVPDGRAARALARLGVDAVGLTGAEAEEGGERAERPLPTRQVRQVMRHAQEEADREGASLMGTDHLLLGLLLAPDSRVAGPLAAAGATEAALREALRAVEPED